MVGPELSQDFGAGRPTSDRRQCQVPSAVRAGECRLRGPKAQACPGTILHGYPEEGKGPQKQGVARAVGDVLEKGRTRGNGSRKVKGADTAEESCQEDSEVVFLELFRKPTRGGWLRCERREGMEKVVLDNSGSLTVKGKRGLGSSYGDTEESSQVFCLL